MHENCHKDRQQRSGNITLCHFDTPKLQDTKEEDDKTNDQCDMLTNKFVGRRRFVLSAANVNWENENDIEKTETLWLYGAAATRSDLPGVETGIMCHSAVGHETNSDKTIDVKFRKESGRVGPLESFKNDFQKLFFSSPTNGMVGWQNANGDKQKQNGNKKPVFRSSQQQQHKATALDLSEVAPDDEFGSYTSEGMYKDLIDGKYEKTIYMKTWTGRTITAVFGPERVTKIVKEEIDA